MYAFPVSFSENAPNAGAFIDKLLREFEGRVYKGYTGVYLEKDVPRVYQRVYRVYR